MSLLVDSFLTTYGLIFVCVHWYFLCDWNELNSFFSRLWFGIRIIYVFWFYIISIKSMEFSALTHTLFIWRKSRWTKRISMERKKNSIYVSKINAEMQFFYVWIWFTRIPCCERWNGAVLACLFFCSDKSSGLMCHSV